MAVLPSYVVLAIMCGVSIERARSAELIDTADLTFSLKIRIDQTSLLYAKIVFHMS